MRRAIAAAIAGVALAAVTGCAVDQPPGRGRTLQMQQETTGAWYYLYLPVGYDKPAPPGRPRAVHPLVMTFHGMKPFDSAKSQIREWQSEADRYGYVVCAPELTVSAFSSPLPLTDPNNARLKNDERAIIAIMDDVYRVADVDPNKVLATSWSYGGYVAHYMANRYPERFSCIAVKQSNFSADLLDPSTVPRYRDRKVAVYYTENDFAICRRESSQAAEWYAQRGFDLTTGIFEKKGHERTPGVAAEFFARACGVAAKTAPVELAQMQMKRSRIDAPRAQGLPDDDVAGANSPSRGQAVMPQDAANFNATANDDRVAGPRSRSTRAPGLEPGGRLVTPLPPPSEGPVRIRLSSTIGVAPLVVSFSALLPDSMRRDAHFLWTDNGEPISNNINGQRVFTLPGDHRIEVLVTTADGLEFKAARTVTVIERASQP